MKTKIVKTTLDFFKMKCEKLIPNRQGEPCAICQKEIGIIQIHDADKKEYFICESCDSKVKWEGLK